MDEYRKGIRFDPEPMDTAIIAVSDEARQNYNNRGYAFRGDIPALIENESHTGCSLLVILHGEEESGLLQLDTPCVVKLGKLNPLAGVVKWKKEIEENIFRIGIEITE